MGFFDRFRRTNDGGSSIAGTSVIELSNASDLPMGMGGSSPIQARLEQLRLTATSQAVEIAQTPLDPAAWAGGRMAFAAERALAADYEAARADLQNFAASSADEAVQSLQSVAESVAVWRDRLATIDYRLATIAGLWRQKFERIANDPHEFGRYERAVSEKARVVYYAIGFLFVASEFMVSAALFRGISGFPGGQYVLALGVVLMLVVVPHYSAKGLKEGFTRFHQFNEHRVEDASKTPSPELVRNVAHEITDDYGFRAASLVVGLLLVAFILPLSILRADESTSGGAAWTWFFILLQACISGYFFLREWYDHGTLSSNLKALSDRRDELNSERDEAVVELSAVHTEFKAAAVVLAFVLTQYPRWDSHAVMTFNATIQHMRHTIGLAQPDFRPLLDTAVVPSLSTPAQSRDLDEFDGIERFHHELVADGPTSRRWWLDMKLPGALDGDDFGFAPAWLITTSPEAILRAALTSRGLEFEYERPAVFDDYLEIDWAEPAPWELDPADALTVVSANGAHTSEDDESGEEVETVIDASDHVDDRQLSPDGSNPNEG